MLVDRKFILALDRRLCEDKFILDKRMYNYFLISARKARNLSLTLLSSCPDKSQIKINT